MHDDLDTLLKQRYAVAKLTDAQLQPDVSRAVVLSDLPPGSQLQHFYWYCLFLLHVG